MNALCTGCELKASKETDGDTFARSVVKVFVADVQHVVDVVGATGQGLAHLELMKQTNRIVINIIIKWTYKNIL